MNLGGGYACYKVAAYDDPGGRGGEFAGYIAR